MRILLIVLVICLHFICGCNEEVREQVKKGDKARISKAEMLAIFEKGEVADGYVINGDDLIDIIRLM